MLNRRNLTRGTTRLVAITLFVAILSAGVAPMFNAAAAPLAATSPTLGAVASYSVLAGQTVTNTGPTRTNGDVGVSPGSAITGFPPGIAGPPGTTHSADAHAAAAQSDNTAAFTFLDQGCVTTYPGTKDLVGENLVPGVYCAGAFTLSGTLTLSGTGVWIFKSATSLITSGTANIVGGDPCNVWWRVVSSATLGTSTSLIGSILASTSITLASGANLNGRALAQTGAVTLQSNNFSGPGCAAPAAVAAAATNTPVLTLTPTSALTLTPTLVLTRTITAVSATTTTATPVRVVALPNTGGAAPQRPDFPWTAVLVTTGIGAIALSLGVYIRRNTRRAKR